MFLNFFKLVTIFVFLEVSASFALITKDEVQSCIDENRNELLNNIQQTRSNFQAKQKNSLYSVKEYRERMNGNVNSRVATEKKQMAQLREQAIKENYNISACDDPTKIFEDVQQDFGKKAELMLQEYEREADKIFNNVNFLLNQFKTNFEMIQSQLDSCQNESCLDEVQDKCLSQNFDQDVIDSEAKFQNDIDKVITNAKAKLLALDKEKSDVLRKFSADLKTCYRARKNDDQKPDNNSSLYYTKSALFPCLIVATYFYFL